MKSNIEKFLNQRVDIDSNLIKIEDAYVLKITKKNVVLELKESTSKLRIIFDKYGEYKVSKPINGKYLVKISKENKAGLNYKITKSNKKILLERKIKEFESECKIELVNGSVMCDGVLLHVFELNLDVNAGEFYRLYLKMHAHINHNDVRVEMRDGFSVLIINGKRVVGDVGGWVCADNIISGGYIELSEFNEINLNYKDAHLEKAKKDLIW